MNEGWRVDTYRDRLTGVAIAIEILPINDLAEHVSNADCPCLPQSAVQYSAPVLIHNAFDGREYDERSELSH